MNTNTRKVNDRFPHATAWSALFCLVSAITWCAPALAQGHPRHANPLAHSTQAIVVTTAGWNAAEGTLQRYERATERAKWRPVGETISIIVGRNGLGWGAGVAPSHDAAVREPSDPVKTEGDGRAPAGIFALGTAFGYAAQPLPGLKLPYLQLTPSVECVDDIHSSHYNRIVDRSAVSPDWNSSEHMRDAGVSYQWGVVVDLNGTVPGGNNPRPGAGSCVFLHIRGTHEQGTAGCTAMAPADLEALLLWLDPSRQPLLVQLTEPAYERLADPWNLPKLPSH